MLPEHGLLVVDDSQHPLLWQETLALSTKGFSAVDFVGLQPGSSLHRLTSVLAEGGLVSATRALVMDRVEIRSSPSFSGS